MKKSKYVIITICSMTFIFLLLFIIIIINLFNWDAKTIATKLKNNITSMENIDIYTSNEITENISIKSIIGSMNSSVTTVTWDDSSSKNNSNLLEHDGIIEVFNNSKEADTRFWYIEQIYEKCYQTFDETIYGKYAKEACGTKPYIYLNKNVLVMLNENLSSEKMESYNNHLATIISKLPKREKYVLTDDQMEKSKSEKIVDIEDSINKLKEVYNATLDNSANYFEIMITNLSETLNETKLAQIKLNLESMKKMTYYNEKINLWDEKIKQIENKIIETKEQKAMLITQRLNSLFQSLNEEELMSVKEEIENINDKYYDNYKNNWQSLIITIESKIKEQKIINYKNSCSSYEYKEVLRNPDNYKGKNTYWFGVVSQKVSSTQYRVGVDCTKYKYIDGYSCENTIYVYYYGDINLIEDDVVKLWGTMDGTITYKTVLGNSLTIPLFNAKYVSIQ